MQISMRCVQKEWSFAGFWYEALFFIHHRVPSRSKLDILYAMITNTELKALQIRIPKIEELLPNSSLQQDILYESRSSHPIVDALGCFEVNSVKWLVFIQVSLKEYEDHRSLCDLFKRAPKNFPVKGNVSVFTHYRRSFESQCSNVLLIYVSPKYTNIASMSLLHDQISRQN